MIQILFALLAGILTVAAPCILPMLPILLGANVGHTSKRRPLFIVIGFIVSFAAASLVLSALVNNLGLSPVVLRNAAIVMLSLFAIFMIWAKPFELLTAKMSGVFGLASKAGQGQGDLSGLLLGLTLGIVWTPCAGPVLGSILTLIATQGSTGHASILLIFYSLGAGIPMLLIAYGSQWLTTKVRSIAKYAVRLQQIFGVLVLALAVVMYFQYDTKLINSLTQFFPQSGLESQLTGLGNNNQNNSAAINFQNLGPAADFAGISHWLNLADNKTNLSLADLKGKVVLIDFWTYSCINCLRTLPYVTKWYNTYKDQGLVVVGIHTPEFAFEKVTDNVQNAMKQYGINYPVGQDNDYKTWDAYDNHYWPAEYLIDQNGQLVYTHFGEGEYDHTENAIRQLLKLGQPVSADNGQDLSGVASPEMYFGTNRLEYLSSQQHASKTPATYTLPTNLALNHFGLEGQWQFDPEKTVLTSGLGKIRLYFSSGKVFMVAASAQPITLKISVDGKPQPDVTVQMSQLYKLFDSQNYSEHIIDIEIPQSGLQAFTFTFG